MLIPLLLLLLGVVVAKFLKFFKLVEYQPVTFCGKYIKARSLHRSLFCIAPDLSRLLLYVFAVVG